MRCSLCRELRGSSQLAPGASLAGLAGSSAPAVSGLAVCEQRLSVPPTDGSARVLDLEARRRRRQPGTGTRLLSRAEEIALRWCQAVSRFWSGPGAEALASVLGFSLILGITVEVSEYEGGCAQGLKR